jgi:ribonuclease III
VTNMQTLTKHLGYTFASSAYLTQALTHRSANATHNERLEYLGDAVLDCVIAEALFIRYPALSEGKLTRMRASLVKGETLAELAKKIELGDALILGQGERHNQGHTRTSTLADALEAIFGAVFLDGGFDASKKVILSVYQSHLDQLTPETSIKDAKTELQEYAHAKKLPTPRYTITKTEGDVHAQHFYVACHINTLHTAGEGTTRRKAEQLAAEKLLEQLKRSGV